MDRLKFIEEWDEAMRLIDCVKEDQLREALTKQLVRLCHAHYKRIEKAGQEAKVP